MSPPNDGGRPRLEDGPAKTDLLANDTPAGARTATRRRCRYWRPARMPVLHYAFDAELDAAVAEGREAVAHCGATRFVTERFTGPPAGRLVCTTCIAWVSR